MEWKFLQGRQIQLLMLLRTQQQLITSKELAAKLEVSDRTVRNDVRILNNVLARFGASIEITRGKGLLLHIPSHVSPTLNDLIRTQDMLQSREERANFLLVRLLLSDEGFQLGTLEDEMFVSRTTLENDISYLRKLVSTRRPPIYLNRYKNRVSIEAREWDRRLVLTKIFSENWDYHSRHGVLLQNTPISSDTFQIILDVIKGELRKSTIKLDDYDLIAIAFTVAVAEFRIRTGHPLQSPVILEPAVMDCAPIVNAFMDELEQELKTPFDENERNGIIISMSFRRHPTQESGDLEEIIASLDDKARHTADLFLKNMLREYGADFSQDKQLYADLVIHISRLEKRLRYSYERRNPLLPMIRSRYIYFFELAMLIRECFQAVYGIRTGADEWGYFADLLITSCNRTAKKHFPNGIPVAFVTHLGRSDRTMLASQLTSIYGNTIDLRGPFSIYQKMQIMAAQPKIIVSTVPLETVRLELVDIPHLTVPTFFDDDVFLQMNRLLRECQESLFFRPLPNPISEYFDPKLFFLDLEFSDESSLITYMTRRIAELGYATVECVNRALEREEWCSTVVENGAAIPRVRVLGPCQTSIAFARLRKPLLWGDQKVSTAFLLAVSESDLPIFGTLLTYLANHLCNYHSQNILSKISSFEELIALL